MILASKALSPTNYSLHFFPIFLSTVSDRESKGMLWCMPGQISHWQTDHVDGHPHLIFIKDKKHDKIIKKKKHLNQIA